MLGGMLIFNSCTSDSHLKTLSYANKKCIKYVIYVKYA